MGVLFYVLVAAQYPFQDGAAVSKAKMYQNLVAGRFKPLPAHVSQGAHHIIHSLLQPQAEDRMSLEVSSHQPA
jgi:hypothetical protein